MNYFFTGCEHYQHNSIIKLCNQPFNDIQHKQSVLISNLNARVKTDDIVFHIGDFLLDDEKSKIKSSEIIKQFNANHIFLVGNHDENKRNHLKTNIYDIRLKFNNVNIQLIHDPKDADVECQLILHSHVHREYKIKELKYKRKESLLINCGIDVNKYYPIRLDEVLNIYHQWLSCKSDYQKKTLFLGNYNKGTLCEKFYQK